MERRRRRRKNKKKERRTLNKTPLLLESVGFSMNNFYRGTFVCVVCLPYVGRYVVLPKNSKKYTTLTLCAKSRLFYTHTRSVCAE